MEIGDKEMEDFLIGEKRHRELVSVIKGIVTEMPKTEIDLSSLESVKEAIENLLKSEAKKEVPKENTELISAITVLNTNLTESILDLKILLEKTNAPKEFEFVIERKYDDKISKVIAKTITK